jgi:hypothetical protein
MTREPVHANSPVKQPPPPPSDFGDEPTDVPGYAGLLGIEAERKGNLYIEARIRRQRAGTEDS